MTYRYIRPYHHARYPCCSAISAFWLASPSRRLCFGIPSVRLLGQTRQTATECWWDVYGGRWMPRKERKPSSSSSSFVLLRSLQLHPSRGVKRVERIYLFISKEDEYYLYPEGDRKAGKKHILLSSPFFFIFSRKQTTAKIPKSIYLFDMYIMLKDQALRPLGLKRGNVR